jgi:endonuclease-3
MLKAAKSKQRSDQILSLLEKNYQNVKCALNFSNPLEMLVSTILSAQCTDERVNKITPALFKKYRTPEDYVKAKPEELQKDIRSAGFYKNKAKSIQGACKVMIQKFHGKIPKTMAEITTLPGIARKSANVILFNSYHVIEGIAVDTHVKRLSRRWGLSSHDNPEKIEKDLMRLIPKKEWGHSTYLIIEHGRRVCKSQKPDCPKCFLNKICPSAFSFNEKGKWIGIT